MGRVLTSCPAGQLIEITTSRNFRQIIAQHELIITVDAKLGDVITTIFIEGMYEQVRARCQLGHLDENLLLPLLVGPMIMKTPNDNQPPRLFIGGDEKIQTTIVALVSCQLRQNPSELSRHVFQNSLIINTEVVFFTRRQVYSSLNVRWSTTGDKII